MQRDSAGLTNQNSELKFRLQSMEQQAKLRDGISVLYFIVLQIILLSWFVAENCLASIFSCLLIALVELVVAWIAFHVNVHSEYLLQRV